MLLKTIKGSWVALVTPFLDNRKIDFSALKKLIEMHFLAKTDGLVICGTTGESATLSHDEKIELMNAINEQTNGKIPLMLGIGTNCTKTTATNTSEAKKLGANAVLAVTPYYNKPPQEGLIQHYRIIAKETDLPVVLYNVPGRTGCNLSADTTLKLSEIENIVAIKEASGDLAQAMEIIRHAPEGFSLLSGEDALNLPIMACGGTGTISVTANIMPRLMKQFNDAALANDWVTAKKIHFQLLDLHHGLFTEANPIPAKAALSLMNMINDYTRPPLSSPTEKTRNMLKNILSKLQQ